MKLYFSLYSFFLIIYLFSDNIALSQEFPISPNGGSSYSVDRFSEEVHFFDFVSPMTYKLKTNKIEPSIFQSLPFFYNKTHKAIYNVEVADHGDYKWAKYEYDFETCISKLLTYAKEFSTMISPNDKIILFPGEGYEDFYSFEDSSYHNYNSTLLFKYDISWLNNDSVYYCRDLGTHKYIFSYNIWTEQIDTLVTAETENQIFISSLVNRPNSNEITYSTLSLGENSKGSMIFKYDVVMKENKMIFPDDNNIGSFKEYEFFMKWSPDGKYLSFLGNRTTGTASMYYLFIDSLKKSLIIENKFSVLSKIGWINNNTVIYENLSEHKIYGYSLDETISKALTVSEQRISKSNKNFQIIGNYPNPFNPSTTIKINNHFRNEIAISIYNTLGQLVKTLYSGILEQGEYNFEWDGKNENGLAQSSGLYFVLYYGKPDIFSVLKINLVK